MRVIPLFAAIAHHPGHAIDVAVISITEVDLRAPITALVLLVACMTMLTEAHLLLGYWQLDLGELGLLLSQERSLVLLSQLKCGSVLVLARLNELTVLVQPLALIVRAAVLVVAVLKIILSICEIKRKHRG